MYLFFFFKQKTAYEMRISYWSSDVCSSDLFINAGGGDSIEAVRSLTNGGVDHAFEVIGLKSTSEQSIKMARKGGGAYLIGVHKPDAPINVDVLADLIPNQVTVKGVYMGSTNIKIGRASCRERVCQYV